MQTSLKNFYQSKVNSRMVAYRFGVEIIEREFVKTLEIFSFVCYNNRYDMGLALDTIVFKKCAY